MIVIRPGPICKAAPELMNVPFSTEFSCQKVDGDREEREKEKEQSRTM